MLSMLVMVLAFIAGVGIFELAGFPAGFAVFLLLAVGGTVASSLLEDMVIVSLRRSRRVYRTAHAKLKPTPS